MGLPHSLLEAVARAFVRHVGNAVGLGVAGDIVIDVWDYWARQSDPGGRAEEIVSLAKAAPAESRVAVLEVVARHGATLGAAEKDRLVTYLEQLPAAIRRGLRRPSDPSGRSLPRGRTVEKAADLFAYLPDRVPRFHVGDRPLAGVDWELEELLGVGGCGEVWKARNPRFDGLAPVALKFFTDGPSGDRLVHHEASVLNQVMRQGRMEGIVPLLHTYLNASPPCLEYEFVEGGTLAALIAERGGSAGLGAVLACRMTERLSAILARVHGLTPPIVHRDLKPANILVQAKADGKFLLRVADFGIGGVGAFLAVEQTRRGVSSGQLALTSMRGSYTPLYGSPQQMAGGDPDPRDDVYALGVIWYQLLTGDLAHGVPPGRGWQDRLLALKMTRSMLDLLIRCVEENPADRPASAAALCDEFQRQRPEAGGAAHPPKATAGEPVSPPPPAATPPAPPEPPADPDVFISYSRRDKERVGPFVRSLEQAGVKVWCDVERIQGGEYYGEVIVKAIRASRVVVVMCSPHSLESDEVHREITLTWETHKRFIPLWLVKPYPYPARFHWCLGNYQYIEAADRPPHEWLPAVFTALARFGLQASCKEINFPRTPAAVVPPPARSALPLLDSRDAARREQMSCVQRLNRDASWTNEFGVRFRLIPPGRFRMGAVTGDPHASANEKPPLTVAIAEPLYVAAFPLTNAAIRHFLEGAGAEDGPDVARLLKDRAFAYRCRTGESAADLPAVEISAEDALTLSRWMGRRDGRSYRLPTEAEWEYLARAGVGGLYWWEEGLAAGQRAVFGGKGPAAPDERRANAWGLGDVLGNVAEWTASEHGALDSGLASKAASPHAAALTVRGGSWRDALEQIRLSRRPSMNRAARKDWLGVRLVCEVGPS